MLNLNCLKLYSYVYFKAKLHPANKSAFFFFYHIGVNLCGIAQFQQLKIASLQSKNPYFFIEVKGIV